MALNFPNNPQVGDTFNTAGALWSYDGLVWNIVTNDPNALQIINYVDKTTNSPDSVGGLVLTSVGDGTYDFQSPINELKNLLDIDNSTNSPLINQDLFLKSDGDGTFSFTQIPNSLVGLTDVDGVTNDPANNANLVLQSDGNGGYAFDLLTMSQISNINLTANSPNTFGDLVLTSLTNGQFGFKSLDDISNSFLSSSDIDVVNGVLGYDQNLNDFITAFTLPTSNVNGGFLFNNAGTLTITNNIFTNLNGWLLTTNANNDLIFQYNGVNMVKFTITGEIEAKDDIIAMVGTVV